MHLSYQNLHKKTRGLLANFLNNAPCLRELCLKTAFYEMYELLLSSSAFIVDDRQILPGVNRVLRQAVNCLELIHIISSRQIPALLVAAGNLPQAVPFLDLNTLIVGGRPGPLFLAIEGNMAQPSSISPNSKITNTKIRNLLLRTFLIRASQYKQNICSLCIYYSTRTYVCQ